MNKPSINPAIPSEVQAMLDHMVASTDAWVKQQQERNARLQRENAEIDRRIQRELFMAEQSRKKRQKELAKQNQIG